MSRGFVKEGDQEEPGDLGGGVHRAVQQIEQRAEQKNDLDYREPFGPFRKAAEQSQEQEDLDQD